MFNNTNNQISRYQDTKQVEFDRWCHETMIWNTSAINSSENTNNINGQINHNFDQTSCAMPLGWNQNQQYQQTSPTYCFYQPIIATGHDQAYISNNQNPTFSQNIQLPPTAGNQQNPSAVVRIKEGPGLFTNYQDQRNYQNFLAPSFNTTSEIHSQARDSPSVMELQNTDETAQKPPYSLVDLVMKALETTQSKQMTLIEIYRYFQDNFPYYCQNQERWKNSLRHCLSKNDCFVKFPREVGNGRKNCYWSLHPDAHDMFTDDNFKKRVKKFIPNQSNE